MNDETPAVNAVVALIEDRKPDDPLRLKPRRGYGAGDRRLSLFIVELILDDDRVMLVDADRVAAWLYVALSIDELPDMPVSFFSLRS